MNKLFSIGFWSATANFILRNRVFILIAIAAVTVFFGMQWKHMRFTYTEANMLPDDHEVNTAYNDFLDTFGEEGNLIVYGVKDSLLFTPGNFYAWNKLAKGLGSAPEVDVTLSVGDLQKLKKRKDSVGFEMVPLVKDSVLTKKQLTRLQYELFEKLPFYSGLVYSPNKESVRTAIYLKKDIVNTPARKLFIENVLIPEISAFEQETGIKVHTSGMPYIRTLNSQNIIDEIGM
ncbi:MAG: putative RND superfamily exporter protein, partial [Flavobacteriales bacterium]